jgi:23S rRNA pseudouridine2605 synthase
MSEPIRLQVFMARCGIASRRRCEEYIREGRVTVNGKRAAIGSKVAPDDRVCLDRRRLAPEAGRAYIVVNKPRGFLCSNQDDQGRPLVKDLLRRIPYRLYHVGRLDFTSSGLIFYTNDGDFARLVSHPSSAIEKEYLIESSQPIPEDLLKRYQAGISIDGQRYRLKRYRYAAPKRVVLTLIEGKNREIRKVFEGWHLHLKSIHRTRIGCVTEKGLPLGQYRRLEPAEIDWFYQRGKAR